MVNIFNCSSKKFWKKTSNFLPSLTYNLINLLLYNVTDLWACISNQSRCNFFNLVNGVSTCISKIVSVWKSTSLLTFSCFLSLQLICYIFAICLMKYLWLNSTATNPRGFPFSMAISSKKICLRYRYAACLLYPEIILFILYILNNKELCNGVV